MQITVLNITQAACYLGVSEYALRKRTEAGKVPFRHWEGRIVLLEDELKAWLTKLPGRSLADLFPDDANQEEHHDSNGTKHGTMIGKPRGPRTGPEPNTAALSFTLKRGRPGLRYSYPSQKPDEAAKTQSYHSSCRFARDEVGC